MYMQSRLALQSNASRELCEWFYKHEMTDGTWIDCPQPLTSSKSNRLCMSVNSVCGNELLHKVTFLFLRCLGIKFTTIKTSIRRRTYIFIYSEYVWLLSIPNELLSVSRCRRMFLPPVTYRTLSLRFSWYSE